MSNENDGFEPPPPLECAADKEVPQHLRGGVERTMRVMHKLMQEGKLPPGVVVPGPDPIMSASVQHKPCADRWDFFTSMCGFCLMDLVAQYGSVLPGSEARPGALGKLICPYCLLPDNVESKGPQFGRIRMAMTHGGIVWILVWKYCCHGCKAKESKNAYFYSNSSDLMKVLEDKGFGFIPDKCDFIFTKYNTLDRNLFQQMLHCYVRSLPVMKLVEQMNHSFRSKFLRTQLAFNKYNVTLDKRLGAWGKQQRREDAAAFGAFGDVEGYPAKVVGDAVLRNQLREAAEEKLPHIEACMASVCAGPDAIICADYHYKLNKGIQVPGGGPNPFISTFGSTNSRGEPFLYVLAGSSSLEDIEPALMKKRDDIERMGGQQPKVVYSDCPEIMATVFKRVWPDIELKQDLYHWLDRYSRMIPAEHTFKGLFIHGLSATMLTPAVGEDSERLKAQYLAEYPGGSMDFNSAAVRKWWKEHQGRWSIRPPDALAAALEAFWDLWKRTDRLCPKLAVPLLTQDLHDVHMRGLAQIRAGLLSDPQGINMHYVDAKGKVHEARSESRQESEFAPLAHLLPGYNCSAGLAHLLLSFHLFRRLVTVRPLTRQELYTDYGTVDHVELYRVNQAAIKAGLPPPYPRITQPAPGITADDYVGGMKSLPRAMLDARAAAGFGTVAATTREEGAVAGAAATGLAAAQLGSGCIAVGQEALLPVANPMVLSASVANLVAGTAGDEQTQFSHSLQEGMAEQRVDVASADVAAVCASTGIQAVPSSQNSVNAASASHITPEQLARAEANRQAALQQRAQREAERQAAEQRAAEQQAGEAGTVRQQGRAAAATEAPGHVQAAAAVPLASAQPSRKRSIRDFLMPAGGQSQPAPGEAPQPALPPPVPSAAAATAQVTPALEPSASVLPPPASLPSLAPSPQQPQLSPQQPQQSSVQPRAGQGGPQRIKTCAGCRYIEHLVVASKDHTAGCKRFKEWSSAALSKGQKGRKYSEQQWGWIRGYEAWLALQPAEVKAQHNYKKA